MELIYLAAEYCYYIIGMMVLQEETVGRFPTHRSKLLNGCGGAAAKVRDFDGDGFAGGN